ncbi:MAG: hypothetical protein ABI778_10600 [Ignavibacteriota bacterium]
MKLLLCIFFSLILVICCPTSLFSQERDPSNRPPPADSSYPFKSNPILYWVSAGWGGSLTIDDIALAYGILINAEHGHHIFSVRAIYSAGIQDIILPHERTFDAALLYGIGTYTEGDKLWFANASFGLGYYALTKRIFVRQDTINVSTHDVYKGEPDKGIGLAWQIQIFSRFSESTHLGFGLTFLGNINRAKSFAMILYSLEILIY